MASMVGELYEALRLAQVPDDKARAAATAVADFERRIGRIETQVPVNTAVLAMNTALVIAVAGRLSSSSRPNTPPVLLGRGTSKQKGRPEAAR